MDVALTQRLVLVIGAVALLTVAGKRKWTTPSETGWVGAALVFACTGWILQAVLNITRSDYPNRVQAILMALALTAPLVISLIVGLFILVRRLSGTAPGKLNSKAVKK